MSDNHHAAHSKIKVPSMKGRRRHRNEVPNQSPAGPGAGDHLQGGVVADLGRGAERPRLQDVLHQAPVAADDVQGLHHKLLGLVWGQKERKTHCSSTAATEKAFAELAGSVLF